MQSEGAAKVSRLYCIDRGYGSHYGSGKLFRFLGKHLVNDHIHLHVKIHADRQG